MMRARPIALVALIGATALNGCETPFNPMVASGADAQSIVALGWPITVFMCAVVLVMGVLIVWAALRNRDGTLLSHAPIDVKSGKRWIFIGGMLFPAIVLTILFLFSVGAMPHVGAHDEKPDLTVHVTAHQWWWEIDYEYDDLQLRFSTANELHVPVGSRVLVRLTSSDVNHSFWVPRLHGKLDAIPSRENRLVLRANEPGVYWGECAEFCGMQHAHMRFLVIADPPEKFRGWATQQLRPAARPDDPVAAQGEQIFVTRACALCHTVRGTDARGTVGPDLTHIGSRRTIAAGLLPNTRARLQAWIVNAQSLKPGAQMPSINDFSGTELNALATYLQGLN